ncbi:GvpL/GvpF family gas vesicle protein [Streptomyces pactum]|uniref:GvpL/GvpF family gas vesicle protein n=1 Tax=Streptomyces pactum TaxID=68249 RepID=A0ABS0NSJ6_9ACTN|nr:GvpL/GvpF family gas vesicle protein [Streptomyces pactum]MBH5338182.1 GvpL/GvpF family gas vesicle protein [Streptomyces pactum]
MDRPRQELRYVYAVTRDGRPAPALPGDLHGVAGGPVDTVRHAGLTALTGPVPAAEFAEAPLRARLEDLDWLADVARAHHRVVDAATRTAGCVIPLRLATVCHDEPGVRNLLEAGRDRFTEALDRLDGHLEWGVKVYAAATPPPAAAVPAGGPGAAGGTDGAGSGRAYLRRRSAERRARDERWQLARDGARQVYEELTPLAADTRLHAPQNTRLSGVAEPNVLNAAFLVPGAAGESFAARVRDLGGRLPAVRLELTGPWAPYSFLSPDDDPPAAAPVPGGGGGTA